MEPIQWCGPTFRLDQCSIQYHVIVIPNNVEDAEPNTISTTYSLQLDRAHKKKNTKYANTLYHYINNST